MGRRSPKEGAVYQDGDRWVAAIELPMRADGKRVRRKRKASTKTEARRLLREMQTELSSHGSVAGAERRIHDTLEDYASYRQGLGLAESTLTGDSWMIRLIGEQLGNKRSNSLTVQDCDRFLITASQGALRPSGERRRPAGKVQLRRIRQTLVAAMRNDMRLGLLTRNPAELSILPPDAGASQHRRAITSAELARLLEYASGPIQILIDLCGRNGLRPAEARALRWEHVDLDAQTLTVVAQMSEHDQFVRPKTKRSMRVIRIDTNTIDRLLIWQEKQEALRIKAGILWKNHDLIVSTRSGTPVNRNNAIRSIRRACRLAAIEPTISPYELRHTAITLQAEAGHNAWQIADWAGTSERMICDVYRHQLVGIAELQPPA